VDNNYKPVSPLLCNVTIRVTGYASTLANKVDSLSSNRCPLHSAHQRKDSMFSLLLAVVMSVSPRIAIFNGPTIVTVTVELEDYQADQWVIQWMDGSVSAQASDELEDFSRTHTYRKPGEYPITVLLYRKGQVVKALSKMVSLKGAEP